MLEVHKHVHAAGSKIVSSQFNVQERLNGMKGDSKNKTIKPLHLDDKNHAPKQLQDRDSETKLGGGNRMFDNSTVCKGRISLYMTEHSSSNVQLYRG